MKGVKVAMDTPIDKQNRSSEEQKIEQNNGMNIEGKTKQLEK